jgi:hypothetical protein
LIRQALLDSDSPGETTYLVLFNSEGKWHGTIPGGTMLRGRPGVATNFVEEQLKKHIASLKLPPQGKPRDIRLPTLETPKSQVSPAGVRLFVKLPDHETTAYRVPVVKAIPVPSKDWNILEYPQNPREVPSNGLKVIFRELFPPAMKEMVGPDIHNEDISGTLTLAPAGSDSKYQYATLTGEVRFILAARTKVLHSGKLQAVIKYPKNKTEISHFQAYYEGTYPETDTFRNRKTDHKVVAIME